jgi:hypothetical protein
MPNEELLERPRARPGISAVASIVLAICCAAALPAHAENKIRTTDNYFKMFSDTCRKMLVSYKDSAELRFQRDRLVKDIESCTRVVLAINNEVVNLDDDLKDNRNQKTMQDIGSFVGTQTKDLGASLVQVQRVARAGSTDPLDAIEHALKEVQELDERWQKAKVNLERYHQEIQKLAEESARKWNAERSDDHIVYINATKELERVLNEYKQSLTKGTQVMSELSRTKDRWERANNSGDPKEIEAAFKEYHTVNAKVVYWLKEQDELNRDLLDISRKTNSGWDRFLSETRESIKYLGDEVSSNNARVYEINYKIFGEK